MPVVPATPEAEARESLEPGRWDCNLSWSEGPQSPSLTKHPQTQCTELSGGRRASPILEECTPRLPLLTLQLHLRRLRWLDCGALCILAMPTLLPVILYSCLLLRQNLTLLRGLEYSGVIMSHCSLKLLASSDPPASASQHAETQARKEQLPSRFPAHPSLGQLTVQLLAWPGVPLLWLPLVVSVYLVCSDAGRPWATSSPDLCCWRSRFWAARLTTLHWISLGLCYLIFSGPVA
ncbi:hypothetical protein AAY473_021601 [Plecturocebus cupreus]